MTTATLLADAEAQYHKLITGKAVRVFVDQNGERVEYQGANADRLKAYIDLLKAQLNGAPAAVRPIRYTF